MLLVDDDTNLLAATARALRREPFELLLAEGPDQALAILEQRPVDVIISDECMPGTRGTEFLGRVRQQYPQVIPMMLTGRANLAVAMAAINKGEVYRFLTKPCDPGELAITIRQALGQKDLIQKARLLLYTVRWQAALLEGRGSAVSPVAVESPTAVILDDVPVDLKLLLAEVETELGEATRRFRVP